ncbi:unnamed protein product [Colias eurytheme]|nr:unnamed protein product [Colias eurytheme]
MAIRRKIEWDGKKIVGYVDFGGVLDTDQAPEAKKAFVFLVIGINAKWKVPVGCFLIDGANGQQKADLVSETFKRIEYMHSWSYF